MGNTVRFGISLDEKLLASFDQLIEQKSYMNRSEAIRDLIRASLVEERLGSEDREAVGTVTLVYNHHVRDLSDKLTEHQHSHHDQIISALHVHPGCPQLSGGPDYPRCGAGYQTDCQ